MSRCLLLAGLGLLAGCTSSPAAPSSPASTLAALDYEVGVASTSPWVLDVTLTLVGGSPALAGGDADAVVSLEIEDGRGARSVARSERGGWPVGCRATCKVHYRFDLSRAAERSGDAFDVAVRSGADVLAPASTWMLRPSPPVARLPVRLAVHPGPGASFAAGFHRTAEEGVFTLRSEELPTAGYTAFGSFAMVRVPVTAAEIDLALLGGARVADDALLRRWAEQAGRSLDAVFGRFPMPRAAVFVVPDPGSAEVTFGRTLPSGGASTLILLGERAGEEALADDWILTHELFHLGTPSFVGEGRWLDEGLATYYEPVLRERAGVRSPRMLWTEFAAGMRRGLPSPGAPGLLSTTEHDRTYWGGATFVLAADVQIRARSGGARSLDEGLRAVLARGGDATRVWSVASFLKVIDEATGVPAASELYALAARDVGCPPHAAELFPPCLPAREAELSQLFGTLGVERGREGGVRLVDDAPLARIRRQIDRSGEW